MQTMGGMQAQEDAAQYAIAVFDDWNSLQAVLGETGPGRGAVLHARTDDPPAPVSSTLLEEVVDLHFERSSLCIRCTRGDVAEGLLAQLADGARSLADALHDWLSPDQAGQLQRHVEKGRVVLWLRLLPTEPFGVVCGRLVQASPHMVGLCTIDAKAY